MEACANKGLSPEEEAACFLQFGCDAGSVHAALDTADSDDDGDVKQAKNGRVEGPHMAALAPAVDAHCRAVAAALDAAGAADQVETLVLDVVAVYSGSVRPPRPVQGDADDAASGDGALAAALAAGDAVVQAAAKQAGDGADSVAAAKVAAGELYGGGAFDGVAAALLEVVAPDWLPTLPPPAAAAFDAFFASAPAPLALDAVGRHLASVARVEGGGGTAVAAPLGADTAASIAAARFVDGGGVADLAAHCAGVEHGEGVSKCVWRRRVPCGPAALAAALAALPDKAAAVAAASAPALHPIPFAEAVAGAAVRAAARGGGGAAAFAGALLTRLARRGWAAAAARGAWEAAGPALARALAADPGDGGDPAGACGALLAGLLSAAASTHPTPAAAAAALAAAIDAPSTLTHPGAVAALDALLAARPLPPRAAAVLPPLLDAAGGLDAALARAAAAWAPAAAAEGTPPAPAAYAAAVLAACVAAAGRDRLDAAPTVVPLLLQGVGARLGQPLDAARRAGMRVGAVLAAVLGGGEGAAATAPAAPPLFAGADLALLPEECWHADCTPDAWLLGRAPPPGVGAGAAVPAPPPAATAAPLSLDDDAAPPALPRDAPTARLDWGAGDGGGGASSGSKLAPWAARPAAHDRPLDRADLATPASGAPTAAARAAGIGRSLMPRPAQVRDVAAALRKGDDPGGVAAAARAAAALVAAPPDELVADASPDAPDLARALLTARVPEWADEEAAASGAEAPSAAARRALVGVTALAPARVGSALADALYSPHLDLGQRYLVLDALTEAARLLASGGVALPAPAAAAAAAAATLPPPATAPPPPLTIAPARRPSRTRVWAPASLAAAAAPPPPPPPTNAFVPHALPWAAALLARCDVESHGVDLFGRDTPLLGRLLTTLAALAAAAAPAREGARVAAALLRLALSPAVAESSSPYVRRCALAATAAAAASLRPAAVEGDGELARSLSAARAWAARAAAADADPAARALAAAAEAAHAAAGAGAALAAIGGGARGDAVGRLGKVLVPGAGALL